MMLLKDSASPVSRTRLGFCRFGPCPILREPPYLCPWMPTIHARRRSNNRSAPGAQYEPRGSTLVPLGHADLLSAALNNTSIRRGHVLMACRGIQYCQNCCCFLCSAVDGFDSPAPHHHQGANPPRQEPTQQQQQQRRRPRGTSN